MSDRPFPHWPRRLKAWLAAAYVGESESKFRCGVGSGKWPHGIADGGNVYWYREDLDDRLDEMKLGGGAAHDPEWTATLNG